MIRLTPLPARLPKYAPSIHGDIPVVWKTAKELVAEINDEHVWGFANYSDRRLELNTDLRGHENPIMMWKTYYHEAHHFHLEDAGLNQILTKDQRELVCEMYATQRIAEMQGIR